MIAKLFVAMVLAGCAGPALAQHKHSHPLKSHHGGEVVEGRRHHFELVLLPAAEPKSIALSLYVTNHHNRPVKLEAAVADATLRSGAAELRVPLRLAGANVLEAEARFDAAADLAVEVSVRIGKLPPETLRFRPLAPTR